MASKRLLAIGSAAMKQLVRLDHHASSLSAIHPKLGNRDVVGFGHNGAPNYEDRPEYPAPAIRFKENSKEVLALREKEKGDWKDLTLQEKKALYRASFCQTYAEMDAPTGDWKQVMALVLAGISLTLWINYFIKTFIVNELPHTITREWQEKQLENMIKQRIGHIDGIASKWDYENKKWK